MIEKKELLEFHPQARLYLVTYLSQGLKVKGYLAIPKSKGPHPLLVYCRGGIKNVGMTRLNWIRQFVEHHYVVFAPFYRGNRGGEGREDFAGEDRYDVLEAMEWLTRLENVDRKKVHLFGFSRGSLMSLFTAMEYTYIKSVVVWGGVSSMFLTYQERVDLRKMLKRVIGGTPNKVPEQYEWRTVLSRVSEIHCPVLIIHGKDDQQVGIEHAYILAEQLKKSSKSYELLVFEEAGHFLTPKLFQEAISYMFEWFKRIEEGEK